MSVSDEEEDYMSDAFLAKLQDVKPSLIKDTSVKRRNEIEMRQQKEKKKTIHEVQKEKLKEGLNKAISSNNKGFEMLKKMGYRAGTSLGTSNQDGIKEPIKINLSEGRLGHGLGLESSIRETQEKHLNKLKRKINACDMSTDEYRKQMREISDKKQITFDLHKLQRTCRMLDLDSRINLGPIHSWFWPEDKSKEDSKDQDSESDSNELSDAEKVDMLRKFLRNSYFYCEFCSIHYKDAKDILGNCPGPNKDDH